MTGYEKILGVMKRQGADKSFSDIKLAVMGEDFSVKLPGLTLLKEDLIFAKNLVTGYKDKDGKTVQPVKEGDLVLVKRLSDDRYIVICEAVSAGA